MGKIIKMTSPVPTPKAPAEFFKLMRPVGYEWAGAAENSKLWENDESQMTVYAGSARSKVADTWVFSLALTASFAFKESAEYELNSFEAWISFYENSKKQLHGICNSLKDPTLEDRTENPVIMKSDKSMWVTSGAIKSEVTKQDKIVAGGKMISTDADADGFITYQCSIFRSSDETDSQMDKVKVGIKYKVNGGIKMYNEDQTNSAPVFESTDEGAKEYMLYDSSITLAAMASASAAMALLNF